MTVYLLYPTQLYQTQLYQTVLDQTLPYCAQQNSTKLPHPTILDSFMVSCKISHYFLALSLLCLLSSFANNKLPFPCTINELVLLVLGQFMELVTSRILLHSPCYC